MLRLAKATIHCEIAFLLETGGTLEVIADARLRNLPKTPEGFPRRGLSIKPFNLFDRANQLLHIPEVYLGEYESHGHFLSLSYRRDDPNDLICMSKIYQAVSNWISLPIPFMEVSKINFKIQRRSKSACRVFTFNSN